MVTLISFILCMLLFIGIGIYAVRNKKQNVADYYVASREVSAPFVGLSSAVSLLNGFMFFGVIGITYMKGVSFLWFFIASIIVQSLCFKFIIPKFSKLSKDEKHLTYISHFSKGFGSYYRYVSILASVLVIGLFGVYASSQLVSGAKTLNYFYDIDNYLGGLFVIAIVVIYCYAGGIRASIWTDVAQSLVMLLAILIMAVICINNVGGFTVLFSKLNSINPDLTNMFFENEYGGWFVYFLSWCALFLGVAVGLPHLMVRYMAIKDHKKIKVAGRYYISYLTIFYLSSFFIGLVARVVVPVDRIADKEFSLLIMAEMFLSKPMIGIILAGIFASLISTVDSMVLVCSSAITKDLFPKLGNKYNYAKYATIFVAILVYLVFLYSNDSVFFLVILAASGLAAVFAPLIILKILDKKPSQATVLSMMVISLVTVILWRNTGLNIYINECLIAIPMAFVTYGVCLLISKLKVR